MILSELFKGDDVDFEVVTKTASRWTAHSKLENGKNLVVNAELQELVGDPESYFWELAFSVGGSTDKTGDGNEIDVFKRVVAILRAFDKAKKPNFVVMSAVEDNRAALYVRLLKRSLPGWKVAKRELWNYSISACKAGEFPVMKYDDQVAISLGDSALVIDSDGEIENASDVKPQALLRELAPEIAKAKEMANAS